MSVLVLVNEIVDEGVKKPNNQPREGAGSKTVPKCYGQTLKTSELFLLVVGEDFIVLLSVHCSWNT